VVFGQKERIAHLKQGTPVGKYKVIEISNRHNDSNECSDRIGRGTKKKEHGRRREDIRGGVPKKPGQRGREIKKRGE